MARQRTKEALLDWARATYALSEVPHQETDIQRFADYAALAWINEIYAPESGRSGVPEIANYASATEGPGAALEGIDELRQRLLNSGAGALLNRSGDPRSMMNSHYNAILGRVEEAERRWKQTRQVPWANELRQEAGLSGAVTAPPAAAASTGCLSTVLLIGITATAVLAKSNGIQG